MFTYYSQEAESSSNDSDSDDTQFAPLVTNRSRLAKPSSLSTSMSEDDEGVNKANRNNTSNRDNNDNNNRSDDEDEDDDDDDEDIKLIYDNKALLERIDGDLKKFADFKREPSCADVTTSTNIKSPTIIPPGPHSLALPTTPVDQDSPILVRINNNNNKEAKTSSDAAKNTVILLDDDDDDDLLFNVAMSFEAEHTQQKQRASENETRKKNNEMEDQDNDDEDDWREVALAKRSSSSTSEVEPVYPIQRGKTPESAAKKPLFLTPLKSLSTISNNNWNSMTRKSTESNEVKICILLFRRLIIN